MTSTKSRLFALVCASVFLCLPAWPATSVNFGELTTGTISAPAGSNSYTFAGNAGDVVDITITTTSGNLSPKIQLYSPANALLASANPAYCNGGTVEMNTFILPASGTYTLIASDCSAAYTGNYAFYLQRIKPPGGATVIPFDQTSAGAIGSAAESNTYTFTAKAGDVVDFAMTTTSGNLSPKIRLYNPDATLNSSVNPAYCNGATIEMNTVTLPATGTYTVLVGDCSDTYTGNYEIYPQFTDAPVGPLGLTFGQTQTGSIAAAAQSDTYTFKANANDSIDFTMVRTSGSLSPKLRLYSQSTGALISSANPAYCNGATIEMNTVKIPATDTYTLLVGDCSDTLTGNYDLYSQRTNNPAGPSNLPFNQTQTGLIGSAAASNTYTFSANANDVVDFTMTRTSGSLSPKIRLYNPDGTLNSSANPAYCNGATIEMNTVTLSTAGTYTVIVGDCSDSYTGNYAIYAQRTKNPVSPTTIVFGGQPQSGMITSAAQSDTYTFTLPANDAVDFTMTTTSGSLSPKIRIYDPTGQLLASANPAYCNGATITTNNVTLTVAGTYTVLVGDCGDTYTGNYNLASQCFGVCPATPTITWPTPAAITYSTPLSATQLDATATASGTSVPGTFVYTPPAGTVLHAGVQTLSTTFTPTDQTNFTKASGSVQITVNKATPNCTWPHPAAISYGIPVNATELNLSCSLAGAYTYTPATGTVLTAGTHTLSVTFTPTDSTDYNSVTATVQLTVNKITPSIKWATPAAVVYGTKLSATQLDATAAVVLNGASTPASGTFTYTPAIGTVLGAGTHTLSVTFTPADDTDYSTPAAISVTLSVSKATPTITWAAPAPIGYGTPLGTAQLDAGSGGVTGTFVYNPVAGTVLGIGTHTLQVTFTPTDTADYNSPASPVMVTLIVNNKGTLSISWATPAAITYGTALGAAQLDASSGGVAGTFVYTPAAGTVLAAGTHTLSVAFTPSDTANYNTPSPVTVMLMVNKETPAITWTAPAAITYGTALSAAQLDASSGGVAGMFVYTPAAGAVLGAGSQALSATFTPTDTADIGTATHSVTLQVNQATPVITWAVPASVPAGTALSATQLDATASIPGTFTYTPAAGAMLAAGTQTLSAVFTPTDSVDYATATTSISIVVTSFALTGTAVTVTRGATTGNTSTITVSPKDGFTGNVALTAAITTSPANAQDPPKLSFGSTSPVNLSGSTAGSATLTISTTAATTSSALANPNRPSARWYRGGAILACLLLVCIPRRRRWFAMFGLVAILFVAVANIAACGGGGGSGGGGGGGGNTGTTPGSYNITVTGTVGPTTTTTTLTLTVQ